jgi:thiamine biosynthesis protein ThiI
VLYLVRFGELALKSRFVRRQLQDRLVSNLLEMAAAEGTECLVASDFGRIYLRADDEAAATSLLARTFGVVSFSPAAEAPAERTALAAAVAEYARPLLRSGMSFAIRPRRSGTHPYTSQDIGREAGSAVWTAVPGLRVDLEHPEREIFVEVRENRAFIFHETHAGPGGLPLGSQGRAVALVEGERDLAAAWLLMRRGARTTVAVLGDEALARPLLRWDVRLKVQPLGTLDQLPEVSRASRAQAVALPWGLERVADRRRAEALCGGAAAFYPLVGLSDGEILELRQRIIG